MPDRKELASLSMQGLGMESKAGTQGTNQQIKTELDNETRT